MSIKELNILRFLCLCVVCAVYTCVGTYRECICQRLVSGIFLLASIFNNVCPRWWGAEGKASDSLKLKWALRAERSFSVRALNPCAIFLGPTGLFLELRQDSSLNPRVS